MLAVLKMLATDSRFGKPGTRPVHLNFESLEFVDCFVQKPGDFIPSSEILKSWKKLDPSSILQVQASICVNRCVFVPHDLFDTYSGHIFFYAQKIYCFIRIWGLNGFYISQRLVLSIYKHACSRTPPLVN